ncbi:WGR domain-containing protein [Thioalkalivibrio sp. HL-Eb18]|uniref:WGR domain-containing protein n=1 Tax=Thioalkalivibrio sp. HL-Eb18 TaxID=1266913 RepID=UPI00038135DE|nr:WGR domain-containing protein [Thioalkalivibrio sp. HL-Eb18]
MNEVRLRKVVPDRNQFRFYRMFIQRGLFGGYAICRESGRIGRPGNTRAEWCGTTDDTAETYAQWSKFFTYLGSDGIMASVPVKSSYGCSAVLEHFKISAE